MGFCLSPVRGFYCQAQRLANVFTEYLPLTMFQANLIVAMLGGFWGRQADGHPGPDLMGRGLLVLNALVTWERMKKMNPTKNAPGKQPRSKPG